MENRKKVYQRAVVQAQKVLEGKRNRGLLEEFIRENGLFGEFRRFLVQRQLGTGRGQSFNSTAGPHRERFLAIFVGEEEGEGQFWCEWLSEPSIEEAWDTTEWIGGREGEKLVLTQVQAERLKGFLNGKGRVKEGVEFAHQE